MLFYSDVIDSAFELFYRFIIEFDRVVVFDDVLMFLLWLFGIVLVSFLMFFFEEIFLFGTVVVIVFVAFYGGAGNHFYCDFDLLLFGVDLMMYFLVLIDEILEGGSHIFGLLLEFDVVVEGTFTDFD